jgi:archaeal type IV pilus assembly protein PilA
MSRRWMDRCGVSPVIATILLVAITVVLSSVLYVMVTDFGDTSPPAPSGAFGIAEVVSNDSMKVTFGSFSKETDFTDCKLTIEHAGTIATAVALTPSGNITVGSYNVMITDLAGNGKISSGDHLTVSNANGGDLNGKYAVILLWTQDGSVIASASLNV